MPNKIKPNSETIPWYGKTTTDDVSNMVSLGHGGIPAKPYGTLDIDENGEYDVTCKSSVNVNVAGSDVKGTIDITEWSDSINVAKYAKANVMGLYPSKERTVTANGTYDDMAEYALVKVTVPGPTGTIKLTDYNSGLNVSDYEFADTTALEPSGSTEVTENGTYDIKNKANVVVNVPTGIEPTGTLKITTYDKAIDVKNVAYADTTDLEPKDTFKALDFDAAIDIKQYEFVDTTGLKPQGNIQLTTYESSLDVSGYATADTTALEPKGNKVIDEYNAAIDVKAVATIDTTNLEPKGNKVVDTYEAAIDVKKVATVDTTGLKPKGEIAITTYGTGIDISGYATADTTALQPFGTFTATDYKADVDITKYATLDTTGLEPTGEQIITTYAKGIDVKKNATIDTTQLEPTGETEIIENGTYNIKDKASVNVNVPTGIEPTGEVKITTYGTGIDVANYATADTTALEPSGSIVVEEFGTGIIDVKGKATADITALEPKGTYTVAAGTYDKAINVKFNEFVDTTALEPTGEVAITTYGTGIDVKGKATADTTALEPKGTCPVNSYGDAISVKEFEFVNTSGLKPTGTVAIKAFAADNLVSGYEYADTSSLKPSGTIAVDKYQSEINVAGYEYVDTTPLQPTENIKLTTYDSSIDVMNAATVDASGLEPTGTYTVAEGEYAAAIDVKSKEFVDTTALQPQGTYAVTYADEYGVVDITKYAKVNLAEIKPTGTLAVTENGTVDVSKYANVEVNVSGGSYDTIEKALTALGDRTKIYTPVTDSTGTTSWGNMSAAATIYVRQESGSEVIYDEVTSSECGLLAYNSTTAGNFEFVNVDSNSWGIKKEDGSGYYVGSNALFNSANFASAKEGAIICTSKTASVNPSEPDYTTITAGEAKVIHNAPHEFNFLPEFNRLVVFGNADMEYDYSDWLDVGSTTKQSAAWSSNGTSGTYSLKTNTNFSFSFPDGSNIEYIAILMGAKSGKSQCDLQVTVNGTKVGKTAAINENIAFMAGLDFANTTLTKGSAEDYIYAIAAYDTSVSTKAKIKLTMSEYVFPEATDETTE